MRLLGKQKYNYVNANFKNVLTIRWYFLASNFSSTMLYCIQVSGVSTRSYLSTTTSNLLTSLGFVVSCKMFLVVGSFGIKRIREYHASCRCSLFMSVVPFFPANFQNVFKIRCFFGSNLFYDSKIWVSNCSFLRSTGF